MNMVTQAFRIEIAYRRNYGGYMRRRILRRLYEEKEKARERSVPDGSDKHRRSQHWQSTLVVNIYVGHRWSTLVEGV